MASVPFHRFLHKTFPASSGCYLTGISTRLVPSSPTPDLLNQARYLDAVSDQLLACGNVVQAERLSHYAQDLRREAEAAA